MAGELCAILVKYIKFEKTRSNPQAGKRLPRLYRTSQLVQKNTEWQMSCVQVKKCCVKRFGPADKTGCNMFSASCHP